MFRNGPGLTDVFGTKLAHPIDGDGLVARLSFVNGRAHFLSKFVDTATRREELEAGRMLFPGQMGSKPPADPPAVGGVKGKGGGGADQQGEEEEEEAAEKERRRRRRGRWRDPSHTNVFFHGDKLLTCHEYTLPHVLDPITLGTLGKTSLDDTLDLRACSAHFRCGMRGRGECVQRALVECVCVRGGGGGGG